MDPSIMAYSSTGGQSPEHAVKSIRLDPPAEPLEDRVPFAKLAGQIPPLCACSNDPKHGFHETARVSACVTGVGRLTKAMRFNQRPMGISQNETDQGCSPVVCNLESELKSNVNPERQQILDLICVFSLSAGRCFSISGSLDP